MKVLHVAVRQIGNSHGVVIPKPLLSHMDFNGEAEMSIEGDALVLRKPKKSARAGWALAAKDIARDDDGLVMGEFSNEADSDLKW